MRILWVGLGRFGRPMAENLLDRGHSVKLVRGSHAVRATIDLLDRGALVFEDGMAVDVCGLCLPTPEDVAEAVRGYDGAQVPSVVDFSTGHPTSARSIAADLGRRGIRYLDAPVSGSIETARTGALTCWLGAESGELDRAAATLVSHVAAHTWPMGAVGAGAAMKLTNQIVHIETIAAIGEGLAFAVAHGIDPVEAVQSMTTASADSAMLRRFGPTIAAGSFVPRFALRLALKDVRYAEAEAVGAGVELGTLSAIRDRLELLTEQGYADDDFSRLADLGGSGRPAATDRAGHSRPPPTGRSPGRSSEPSC